MPTCTAALSLALLSALCAGSAAVLVNTSLTTPVTGAASIRGAGSDPGQLTKSVYLTRASATGAAGSSLLRRQLVGNGINYRGGPVMLGTVNVYYIWYGAWNDATTTDILVNLVSHIGTGGEHAILPCTNLPSTSRLTPCCGTLRWRSRCYKHHLLLEGASTTRAPGVPAKHWLFNLLGWFTSSCLVVYFPHPRHTRWHAVVQHPDDVLRQRRSTRS